MNTPDPDHGAVYRETYEAVYRRCRDRDGLTQPEADAIAHAEALRASMREGETT